MMATPLPLHGHTFINGVNRHRQRQPDRPAPPPRTKSVATTRTVHVNRLDLSGNAAGNYQLLQPAPLPPPTSPARALTVSATGANKVYDATTSATITLADTGSRATALRPVIPMPALPTKMSASARRSISTGSLSPAPMRPTTRLTSLPQLPPTSPRAL
jgi:hypothetical protein